jgi:hypothetical protein
MYAGDADFGVTRQNRFPDLTNSLHSWRELSKVNSLIRIGMMRYATRRKVAGSSPDEIIEFLNLPYPSSSTIALALTQPLTEMSTRNFGGDAGVNSYRCVRLTTSPPSVSQLF